MDPHDRKRLRGAVTLLHDGVDEGSRFIERHHREANGAVYSALRRIPAIAAPTRWIERAHGALLTTTYTSVRAVNSLVAAAGSHALPADEE